MKNDAFTSHHGFAVGSTIVSIVNCTAAVGPPISDPFSRIWNDTPPITAIETFAWVVPLATGFAKRCTLLGELPCDAWTPPESSDRSNDVSNCSIMAKCDPASTVPDTVPTKPRMGRIEIVPVTGMRSRGIVASGIVVENEPLAVASTSTVIAPWRSIDPPSAVSVPLLTVGVTVLPGIVSVTLPFSVATPPSAMSLIGR
jgi:hypothetical protein